MMMKGDGGAVGGGGRDECYLVATMVVAVVEVMMVVAMELVVVMKMGVTLWRQWS